MGSSWCEGGIVRNPEAEDPFKGRRTPIAFEDAEDLLEVIRIVRVAGCAERAVEADHRHDAGKPIDTWALTSGFLRLPWYVQNGILKALGVLSPHPSLTDDAITLLAFRAIKERGLMREFARQVEAATARVDAESALDGAPR